MRVVVDAFGGDNAPLEIVMGAADASIQFETEITLTGNNTATVENNKWTSGGLQVINLTGNELPHTGGMGTVLFILIGSLMVLGFGVLLVTKLRMSKVAL